MRATLLWMLWVPGSWNWSSLGSSMVAPGDLSHDMPNNDKCHVHATMHLMSYSIHSDRPLGWCIPCLQCGKRPATATAKPVNGYMRPRATWKSLSWPLSSNSPSLRHKSSVKNHVSNSHDMSWWTPNKRFKSADEWKRSKASGNIGNISSCHRIRPMVGAIGQSCQGCLWDANITHPAFIQGIQCCQLW